MDISSLNPKVLVVDDEQFIRKSFMRILGTDNYQFAEAGTLKEADSLIAKFQPDVILLDVKLPDGSGLDFLEKIKSSLVPCEVVVITAFGSVEMAVEAVKKGAFDFLMKPVEPVEKLRITVKRALEKKMALERIDRLEQKIGKEDALEKIYGVSSQVKSVINMVKSVAPTDATVLITGESGTGKELVARAIHELSSRRDSPFIPINCSALTETLIESELFGHEKGAFTGAVSSKRWLFEVADGGTVFLDEIGEMPMTVQPKLLRLLESGEVRRVGGTNTFHVNVRVISATHRNLQDEIKKGNFREDLYYRLSVVSIHIPPLRERKEDIPVLANLFLKRFARKYEKNIRGFSDVTMKILTHYDWPGNVRELENVVERAVIMEKNGEITPVSLPEALKTSFDVEKPEEIDSLTQLPYTKAKKIFTASFEKRYLEAVLKKAGGSISKAARMSGLDRSNFRKLLKKAGLR